MDLEQVPGALQERLGIDATSALLQLFRISHREVRTDVMAACTERFERRLVEEIAGVRVQIAQVEASIRRDMTEMGASLRQEMSVMDRGIRVDMADTAAALRRDIVAESASIRQELASGRVELLKWCFLFWIGQVFAMAGLMSVMLRLARP